MKQEILHIMPVRLRESMAQRLQEERKIEEIRIRIGQPIELRYAEKSIWLPYRVNAADVEEMLTFISQYSLYAYEEEIRQGYLTIKGGNRIGFAGQVRLLDGQVSRMTNIRFLNIRIAREWKDCARELLPWLYKEGEFLNTLLLSAPGVGKTTCLRDCIRLISNGDEQHSGKKVCVIDERSEIAACHLGIPCNDLGKRTDVLDGCPKREGMKMALRSMSPEVIAVDELGGADDASSIEEMLLCGCKILGTMHGDHMEHVVRQSGMERIYQKRLFQRYVFLTKRETGTRTFHVYDQECRQLC